MPPRLLECCRGASGPRFAAVRVTLPPNTQPPDRLSTTTLIYGQIIGQPTALEPGVEERTLLLNQLAQGLRPTGQGIAWFEALADNEQLNTLRKLAVFCLQAGATSQDAQDSILRAGIRPTHTPAVLITRGTLHVQLGKIANLPRYERIKAFTLLIALLSIADERRRTHLCGGQCSHAWHHLGNTAS